MGQLCAFNYSAGADQKKRCNFIKKKKQKQEYAGCFLTSVNDSKDYGICRRENTWTDRITPLFPPLKPSTLRVTVTSKVAGPLHHNTNNPERSSAPSFGFDRKSDDGEAFFREL